MPRAAGGTETQLARLEVRLHAFRAEVLRWQLEHARHHVANETRWGLVALMREHPFRTLGAGMVLGAALISGLGGPHWWELVKAWFL